MPLVLLHLVTYCGADMNTYTSTAKKDFERLPRSSLFPLRSLSLGPLSEGNAVHAVPRWPARRSCYSAQSLPLSARQSGLELYTPLLCLRATVQSLLDAAQTRNDKLL